MLLKIGILRNETIKYYLKMQIKMLPQFDPDNDHYKALNYR